MTKQHPVVPTAPNSPALYPTTGTLPEIFRPRSINLLIDGAGELTENVLLSQLEVFLTAPRAAFLTSQIPEGAKPVQCGMITADLTTQDYRQIIENMGLDALADAKTFPIVEWGEKETTFGFTVDLQAHYEALVAAAGRPIDLLIIMGLQHIMPAGESSKQRDVALFCGQLRKFLQDKTTALLGAVGTAKMRYSDGFRQRRHNTHGAAAWGEKTTTNILVEKLSYSPEGSDSDDVRRVVVMRKGVRDEIVHIKFDANDRAWVTNSSEFEKSETKSGFLTTVFKELPVGTQKTRKQWLAWSEIHNVSLSTFKRWWTELKDANRVEQIPGTEPREFRKVAAADDHPEIDTTDLEHLVDSGVPCDPDDGESVVD